MTRYIDADALREQWLCLIGDFKASDFVYSIDIAPPIDAEPVRHGKRREYPSADGLNQCSVCGVLRFGNSNYCPNCGAYMRGEDDAKEN
jgi:hypothetical protein